MSAFWSSTWLLAAFHPRGPYTVLDVTGESGSAKSTLLAILRSLIDPNVSDLRAPPREERDLAISAGNSWVLCYDNLSPIPDWLSDAFARLATGGGFGTRLLYSDDEGRLFHAQRPILLGAIEQIVKKGDLADRIISLMLEPISDDRRRGEREFWEAFEQDRPSILGGLLSAVSHGLRELPHVETSSKPRMADFFDWAMACGDGWLWYRGEFCKAYAVNRTQVTADVVDADAVSTAIRTLMRPADDEPLGEWKKTATAFLAVLETIVGERTANSKSWPDRRRPIRTIETDRDTPAAARHRGQSRP